MFHGFTDKAHTGLENAQHKHLDVQKFEAFLQHLVRHFQVISLDEAVQHLQQGTAMPKKAMVLTFDDGFHSNYRLAYPLLKKWRVPATIYLATEYVDELKPIWVDRVDHAMNKAGKTVKELVEVKRRLKKLPQENLEAAVAELENELGQTTLDLRSPALLDIYRPLTWEQIREMQESGLVSFGAHTHTHKILGRCSDETIRQEARQSKRIIEQNTGRPCVHFCYPNGGIGDSSESSERILQEEGYKSSVLALGSLNSLPCTSFPIDRLGVTNGLSQAEFELTVCGFLPLLHELRQKRAKG